MEKKRLMNIVSSSSSHQIKRDFYQKDESFICFDDEETQEKSKTFERERSKSLVMFIWYLMRFVHVNQMIQFNDQRHSFDKLFTKANQSISFLQKSRSSLNQITAAFATYFSFHLNTFDY